MSLKVIYQNGTLFCFCVFDGQVVCWQGVLVAVSAPGRCRWRVAHLCNFSEKTVAKMVGTARYCITVMAYAAKMV